MDFPPIIEATAGAVGDLLGAAGPLLYVGAPVALVALFLLGLTLRRWGRGRSVARVVTALATVLGMSWSAQGMWDATTGKTYAVPWQVASIIFIVFEAMLAAQMLKAHEYRGDLKRRARFIKGVWLIATIMGVIVAFGEGLGQAPLRLAVPLLVAFNWYMDLTADDDPDEKLATSWRWTAREVGLALGLLRFTEADQRDATNAERKALTDRMARLAFAQVHGWQWAGILFHRDTRLAKLKLSADREMIAEVSARLALASTKFEIEEPAPTEEKPAPETHPVMPPQPAPPIHVPTPEPTPAAEPPRRPRGTGRVLDGRLIRADEVYDVARDLVLSSITDKRPTGISTAELIAMFSPPLGQRTAEGIAAEARKLARERKGTAKVNGHVPDLVEVPFP